ncbi:MAG: hypothetical protein B6U69_00250 [Thermofilum sp. ex4484_15]|nr:MAG: hypothetical protein B6U69_00250 [Thermofilum sp. ex4484_15]
MDFEIEIKEFRIPLALIFLCALVMSFIIGGLVPLTNENARHLYDALKKLREEITSERDYVKLALRIYFHNASLAILMVLPLVGVVWSFITLFTTGLALNAFLTVKGIGGVIGKLPYLSLSLIEPHSILEFVSYSLLSSEGVILSLYLKGGKIREGLRSAFKVIIISLLVLLFAALIEAYMITILKARP